MSNQEEEVGVCNICSKQILSSYRIELCFSDNRWTDCEYSIDICSWDCLQRFVQDNKGIPLKDMTEILYK